jgi:hypothetical protein
MRVSIVLVVFLLACGAPTPVTPTPIPSATVAAAALFNRYRPPASCVSVVVEQFADSGRFVWTCLTGQGLLRDTATAPRSPRVGARAARSSLVMIC